MYKRQGLTDVKYESKAVERCGITGTLTDVKIGGEIEESIDNDHHHEHHHHHNDEHKHSHHHEHSNMKSITEIINGLNIPEKVKNDAIEVYNIIADAESKVHNKPVDMIYFHEVGNKDAIADIVGVSYMMYESNVDNIYCSNINVGSCLLYTSEFVLLFIVVVSIINFLKYKKDKIKNID